MAVTLRTPTTATNAASTTNGPAKTTGLTNGDVVILRVGWGPTGPTVTPPTGFTQLGSDLVFSDNSWTQRLYIKVITNAAGEPGTWTCTFNTSTYSDIDAIAFVSPDTTTPVAGGEVTGNTGTGLTSTGTGFTPGRAGQLLHYAVSSIGARTTGPSGMTNQETYDTNIYADSVATVAGVATGNKTSVYAPSQIWAVHLVAVQEPSSGVTGTGSGAMSSFVASGSGTETFTGTGSGAAAPFAASGSGNAGASGTGSGAMAPFAASGSGTNATGTGSAALSPFAASGSGTQGFIGTGSAALSRFAASGAGAAGATGTGSGALNRFAASGVGTSGMGTAFPITPSADGRYHIDANGDAYPILCDSAWGLINQLDLSDAAFYLDDRLAKGYTAIILQLMTLGSSPGPTNAPKDWDGNYPFTLNSSGGAYVGTAGTADFASVNDTYWANARALVDLIASKGMLAICYPTFWGFGGSGVQGCATDITNAANTSGVCTAFGTYLATGHGTFAGFASCTNAWFADGGDYGINNASDPSATLESRTLDIAAAMQAAGCGQLRYFDGQSPCLSTDEPAFEDETQTQPVYTYGGIFPTTTPTTNALHTYQQARAGWNYTPVSASQGPTGSVTVPPALPSWLKETAYAFSPLTTPTATRAMVRKAELWAWLSGCTAGRAHGNEHIWAFPTGWETALNDDYEIDAGLSNALIITTRWQMFIPSELSGLRRLIPSANGTQSGTPDGYVAASMSSDGIQLIAYVPTLSTGTQTFTVDLRSMAGTARARWWDPTDGTFSTNASADGTYSLPNSASAQSFTTPGTNTGGDNDWILFIDVLTEGTGSAALHTFAASGTGTQGMTGTGSAALSRFAASGTGAQTMTGTGSAAAAPFGASGSGALAITGTGSAAMAPFGAVGSATQLYPVPSFLGLQ